MIYIPEIPIEIVAAINCTALIVIIAEVISERRKERSKQHMEGSDENE